MVYAIIYKDEKSSMIFCEDGRIYFENKGTYVDAKDALKAIKSYKMYKIMPGMIERKAMIEKYLSMKYDEAAKLHCKNQTSKGRKGKIYEGEFNGQ